MFEGIDLRIGQGCLLALLFLMVVMKRTGTALRARYELLKPNWMVAGIFLDLLGKISLVVLIAQGNLEMFPAERGLFFTTCLVVFAINCNAVADKEKAVFQFCGYFAAITALGFVLWLHNKAFLDWPVLMMHFWVSFYILSATSSGYWRRRL